MFLVVKEGTNKAIVVNSAILYIRLVITSLCGFFTTRFALQALGVVDYGLFSVLGGIIALIDVANAVMINTTTRFMTVALGKGDEKDINEQFNINLRIHFFTALFSLLIAFTIGYWYIHNYLNYEGDIDNATIVFFMSVISAAISMVGVPFQGLITAKENFMVTSIPAVLSNLIKLAVSWLLVYFFSQKLLIFAGTQALCTIYPMIAYAIYCYRHYPKIVRLGKVNERKKYKEVLSFSGWTLYGTLACMAKSQGASIVINLFFTTVLNAALGVANMLTGLINTFARNAAQPMFPQITKSYSIGDMDRCKQLLCMTSKVSILVTLLFSAPFLIDAEWILRLWLADVPPMAVTFTLLLIADLLINAFDQGIGVVVKANGNIGVYEFFGNSLRLAAIVVSYFILKMGAAAETLLYTYIVVSAIVVIVNQFILKHVTKIDYKMLIRHSYVPSILVMALFSPILIIKISTVPILNIMIGFLYLLLLVWFIGLTKRERLFVKRYADKVISKSIIKRN